jgi:hypothetical protein
MEGPSKNVGREFEGMEFGDKVMGVIARVRDALARLETGLRFMQNLGKNGLGLMDSEYI